MNRIGWFLVILATLAASSKGYFQNWETRIVGGDQISIEDAPYQAALYKNGDFAFCGGTIIAPRFVLTTAYCLVIESFNISVRVGSNRAYTNGRMVPVKQVIIHDNYTSNTEDYDFALLELEEDIPFDKTMQPAALPKENEDVPDGAMMRVTGWGRTRNPDENRAVLRGISVPKMNQEECVRVNAPDMEITPRMMCAKVEKGGKDTCYGDSGSPLVYNGTLVGLVAWGGGCATSTFPGLYSRVASVIPWIKENMVATKNRL